MNILNFTKLIHEHWNDLAEAIHFRDSQLVIDANSLVIKLYVPSCLNESCARYLKDGNLGELSLFESAVRKFFKNLELCRIKPVLIFDQSILGMASYEEDIAFKEVDEHSEGDHQFDRTNAKLKNPTNVLPHRLLMLFLSVITELEIERHTKTSDTQYMMAQEANERKCPVLSGSGHFIIHPLDKGFLYTRYFQHMQPIEGSSGAYAIKAYLYSHQKLAQVLPNYISNYTLPTGSEIAETSSFLSLLQSICDKYNHRMTESCSTGDLATIMAWVSCNYPKRAKLDMRPIVESPIDFESLEESPINEKQ